MRVPWRRGSGVCARVYLLVSSAWRRGDVVKSFMGAVDPRRGVYHDRSYSSSRGGCRRNEWF